MILRGVPKEYIYRVAEDMGITIYNFREEGTGFAFVLRPASGSDAYRAASNTGRRKWAISYEGHYVFMEAIFNRFPEAKLRSALAKYNGQDEFYRFAPIVGLTNVGSMINPVRYEDAKV